MNTDPRRTASRDPAPRLGRKARLLLATLALGLLGVLVTARVLRPDPRGFGTHTQLGLGACGFRELTGRPCPACGMTTAFAWAIRGRLDRAWEANPAGGALAPLCVLMVPWLLSASISGRPRPFRSADGPIASAVLLGAALALASWAMRMLGSPR